MTSAKVFWPDVSSGPQAASLCLNGWGTCHVLKAHCDAVQSQTVSCAGQPSFLFSEHYFRNAMNTFSSAFCSDVCKNRNSLRAASRLLAYLIAIGQQGECDTSVVRRPAPAPCHLSTLVLQRRMAVHKRGTGHSVRCAALDNAQPASLGHVATNRLDLHCVGRPGGLVTACAMSMG